MRRTGGCTGNGAEAADCRTYGGALRSRAGMPSRGRVTNRSITLDRARIVQFLQLVWPWSSAKSFSVAVVVRRSRSRPGRCCA